MVNLDGQVGIGHFTLALPMLPRKKDVGLHYTQFDHTQWTYHAIQNGGAEVVQFGQCLHASQDCRIHSDNRFDVQECESC